MVGSADGRSDAGARPAAGAAQGLGSFLRSAAGRLAAWAHCRRGVSAVEFALLAPMLGFSLIATVDLGFGLTERMAMDHALRAGAQTAMADPGAPTVLAAMRSAARMNFTLDDEPPGAGIEPLSLSATRYAVCPENLSYAVSPSTICSGAKPTFIFYRMSAQKTYQPWLIPTMRFERLAQVQIR